MKKFKVTEYHETRLIFEVLANNKKHAKDIVSDMSWDEAKEEDGPSLINTIAEEIKENKNERTTKKNNEPN